MTAMPSPRQSRTPPPSSEPSHNPRRPSISNTMHWLSRSSTQSPPYSPSKTTKIPEPKRVRTIDSISQPSNGTLGAGAIVVRTPDEALRETGVRLSPQLRSSVSQLRASLDRKEKKSRPHTPQTSSPKSVTEPISPPMSPPLPPLPLPEADEEIFVSEPESPGTKTPPRPNRAPPPLPIGQSQNHSLRSSLKGRSISSATADDAPTVPPLPPHVVASTQPPPFQVLLVSEPPSVIMDPSKVIVILDTCTATHKTTLSTIHSRSSHLSNYLTSQFSHCDTRSIASSKYSTDSDDLATYNRHLTSQGCLPSSINIHLFLDRPSAPYSHILSYLRSPVIEGQPEVLPRALQIHSSMSTQARLDNLIDVRDEAAFLSLDGLYKLCTDEIRLRYGPRFHARGNSASSGASIHSLHASVYSLHTLLERVETDIVNGICNPSETDASAAEGKVNPLATPLTGSVSPPTPQSWEGPLLEQRRQSQHSQRSQTPKSPPPAGWI